MAFDRDGAPSLFAIDELALRIGFIALPQCAGCHRQSDILKRIVVVQSPFQSNLVPQLDAIVGAQPSQEPK